MKGLRWENWLTSLDRDEKPIHQEEEMSDQQKRLFEKRSLQRETDLGWS
jgi:hypothetical protein